MLADDDLLAVEGFFALVEGFFAVLVVFRFCVLVDVVLRFRELAVVVVFRFWVVEPEALVNSSAI